MATSSPGLISKLTPQQDRGVMLGVAQSLGSLSRILGPIWGGILFDLAGPAGPYVTTAALMAVATAVALALPHGARNMADQAAELKSEVQI